MTAFADDDFTRSLHNSGDSDPNEYDAANDMRNDADVTA